MDKIVSNFDRFAASAHQKRIWFIDRFETGSVYSSHPDYHNIPLVIQFTSTVDVEAMQRALQVLLSDHEVLRTCLFDSNDQLDQNVFDELACPIQSQHKADKNEFEIALRAMLEVPFDFDQDALVRAYYQPWQQGGSALVLVLNHAIADSPSLSILARALMANYEAQLNACDIHAELPELQYVDYSEWLSQMPSDNIDALYAHWKYQLRDKPLALEIPTTRPRQAIHTYTQKYESLRLSSNLVNDIDSWCQQHNYDRQSFFYSAFISVLYLYSRQSDLIIGSWFDQRKLIPELANTAGAITNLVCLRQTLTDDMKVEDIVGDAGYVLKNAEENSALPFDTLVQMLNPENDMSRTALFDVLFKYDEQQKPQGQIGELAWAYQEVNLGYGKYDLNMLVRPDADSVSLHLTYNLDIYSKDYAVRVLRHIEIIMAAMLAGQVKLGDIDLVAHDELKNVTEHWASYATDYDRQATIVSMFEAQVARHPQRTALSIQGEKWSYEKLDAEVNRRANWMLAQGVEPEQLVGVMMAPSLELVATLLAILKAGGAYLPIDPNAPSQRLKYQLEDSGVSLILADEQSTFDEQELPDGLSIICLNVLSKELATCSVMAPKVEIAPNQLAYCIYTSGSTGKPKGVLIEHKNVVRLLANEHLDFEFSESDVWTIFHNFNFDFSVWEMYGALLYGGQAVIVTADDKLAPEHFAKLLSDEKVTVLNQTPSAFYNLEPYIKEGESHLRYVIFGGEALIPTRLKHFHERHSAVKLINMYGITETTVHTTFINLSEEDLNHAASNIGRPLPGVACYILDEQMRAVPIGVEGEIFVAGDGVARGYLNKPELTAERFIELDHKDIPYRRLYRSGDIGRWLDNGQIEYKGRMDSQVHVRGFRIEIGEIESALDLLEELLDAVVVVRHNRLGDAFLAAFVVPADVANQDLVTQLKVKLKTCLPAYMIPTVFQVIDAVPRTLNGKVDIKALPELNLDTLNDYVAPRNDLQQMLCEIWQSVLKLETPPSITANFFEIGGHSLLATQIIAQTNARLGLELSIKTLFEYSTVEEYEAYISSLQGVENQGISPVKGDVAPLSYAQQRLWFIDQLEETSSHYVISAAVQLDGCIDESALQLALDALLVRHSALRTVFKEEGGVVHQHICAATSVNIEKWSVVAATASEQQQLAQQKISEIATRPYDLSNDLMLRVSVGKLSDTVSVLTLMVHHIVFDAVSADILTREFCDAYQAADRGVELAFPELPIRFIDFAAWQRANLEAGNLQDDVQYWIGRLENAPVVHSLPLDKPRPTRQSYRGSHLRVTLPSELAYRVRSVALENQATLFMALYSTFTLLMSRWSNNKDVVIATPVAGREQAELGELVGYFVNTIVLRNQVDESQSFSELLSEHKQMLVDSIAHQHVPLEYLLDVLKPERSLSHNPLFQLMFSFNTSGSETVTLGDLDVKPFELAFDSAQVDLHLAVNERNGEVELVWLYATDLFEAQTITAMNESFMTLLSQVASEPQETCKKLTLLNPKQQANLVKGQHSVANFDLETPLDVYMQRMAKAEPHAPAVVFEQQVLSYYQLDQLSNHLAHQLVELGVRAEVPVALAVERSAEMMVGLYAIWKAGGVYVPIDPNVPQSRVEFLLKDSGAAVLLTTEHVKSATDVNSVRTLVLRDEVAKHTELMASSELEAPNVNRSINDLAYILYTSGSTGNPKGVMVEHKALANRIWWMDKQYSLAPHDVVLQKTPITFDVSLWELTWPFIKGASLVLAKPEGHKEPEYLERLIIDAGITTLHFVPSMLSAMLNFTNWPVAGKLRQVFCSGEALTPVHQEAFFATVTQAALHNLYGPTEAAIDVSYWQCAAREGQRTIPIGKPIDNIRLYVLDDALNVVPQGVAGELYIAGVGLARGYLNLPEQTEHAFVVDPFNGGGKEKMYKTGDLVRMQPDGNLEYIGRRDNQVKVNGQRIELGEVESQILTHTDIKEAVVGLVNSQLVAWIVAVNDVAALTETLQHHLQERLPKAMIPVMFVQLDSIPVTVSGKADRKALAAQAIAPIAAQQYEAPQGPVEALLCDVWQQVLQVPKIGRYDNFFTLGGDSILSIRVIAALKAKGYGVTVADMFEHQSVAHLAPVLTHTQACSTDVPVPFSLLHDSEKVIVAEHYQDAYPMSSLQLGMVFHSQVEDHSAIYQDVFTYHIRYTLEIDAFEQAVGYVMKSHPALRTSYLMSGERPLQCVHKHLPVPLVVKDIRHLNDEQQNAYISDWIEQEKQDTFDWFTGPLFRVVLLRRANDRFQLGLIFHHSILDGWSVATFSHELLRAYQSILNAEALPEPVENRLFSAFIAQEQRVLESGEGLAFWQSTLAGTEQTRLPRKANAGDGVTRGQYLLDAITPLSAKLDEMAREVGVPVQTLLLLAHLKSLANASGENQVISNVVHNSRPEMDGGMQTLGLFLNSLPIRFDFKNNSWRELVAQLQQVNTQILQHRNVPLAAVQRATEQVYEETLFNYTHFHVQKGLNGLQGLDVLDGGGFEENNFNFVVDVKRNPDSGQITALFDFNVELFDSQQIEQIANNWVTVCEAMLADLDQRHGQLDLMPPQQRAQLMTWGTGEARAIQHVPLVHTQIKQQSELNGDKAALVFDEQQLTYKVLADKVDALACALQRQGVQQGDMVGLHLERSIEMVISLLAVMQVGASYLPLDPSYPVDRLNYMLDDSGCGTVICDEQTYSTLTSEQATFTTFSALMAHGASQQMQPVHVSDDDTVYVIYTSGSTGKPKGVSVSHANLRCFIDSMQDVLNDANGTWLAVTALSFDIAALELLGSLANGYTVVIAPEQGLTSMQKGSDDLGKLDFGLFYFGNNPSHSEQNIYRLLMEGARFADQNGFTSVWTPERHYTEFGGLFPNPAITGSALAAITSNVAIRSGSVVLPINNPVKVVEDWSVIDNISQGRVGLSMAAGWHANDFVFAKENYADRNASLFTGIDEVRRLWKDRTFDAVNANGEAVTLNLYPTPVQQELPIWLTVGGNPASFEQAGQRGLNLLTHLLGQTAGELADKIALYRKAWKEAGHAGEGHVTLMVHTYVAPTEEQALDAVKAPFKSYLASSLSTIRGLQQELEEQLGESIDTDVVLEHAFNRYAQSAALFGSVESCIDKAKALRQLGVDELGCLIDFGVDCDEALAALPLLKQVKDAFAKQPNTAQVKTHRSIAELIEHHRVTHVQCTPSFASALLNIPANKEKLASLKHILLGGEALPEQLAADMAQLCNATVHNVYGPTEATVWASRSQYNPQVGKVYIGKPLANYQLYVVDENLQLVGKGLAGELLIAGAGVAQGYLHRPELTAERFVDNPFGEAKAYLTGDLVRWSGNGELEYISRKDNQIKISGHRIELGEIESALEQIEAIKNAVVVGVDNGAGKQLLAFVVFAEDEELDANVLKQSLLDELPHYMVPTLWQSIDAMPLTPNGKVDRKALQALQAVAQQHVEPLEGELELQLAQIWANILKVDIQLIGRNANFFALGGHSLVLLNLVNAIRDEFELDVSMGDVFNRETLADLAELLAERKAQADQRASYLAVTTAQVSDDESEELLI